MSTKSPSSPTWSKPSAPDLVNQFSTLESIFPSQILVCCTKRTTTVRKLAKTSYHPVYKSKILTVTHLGTINLSVSRYFWRREYKTTSALSELSMPVGTNALAIEPTLASHSLFWNIGLWLEKHKRLHELKLLQQQPFSYERKKKRQKWYGQNPKLTISYGSCATS